MRQARKKVRSNYITNLIGWENSLAADRRRPDDALSMNMHHQSIDINYL
jgi:hypothetical protein